MSNGFQTLTPLPAPAPKPTPVPWLKWPPDKKIWAGGLAGVAAWVLLSVLAHFGFDPQPMVDAVTMAFGAPHLDLQASLAGLIALLVAHWTTPSLQDIVSQVNNAVVEVAAATPENPTTAVVVSPTETDERSKELAKQGALPADVTKKMIDAGVVSPKELPPAVAAAATKT